MCANESHSFKNVRKCAATLQSMLKEKYHFFSIQLSFFISEKYICILRGQVFVK